MAGRAGTEIAVRGQDKHLHYSRGVTVEEMLEASMALMRLVPTEPSAPQKGRDLGRDERGRDRKSYPVHEPRSGVIDRRGAS